MYGATRDRRDPPASRFRLLFSPLFCTKRAFERLTAPVTWVPVILSRAEFRGPIAKVQPDGATNPSDQEQVKRIQGWRLQERRNRKRVREGCPEGFPTRRRMRPGSGSPRLTSRLGESFPRRIGLPNTTLTPDFRCIVVLWYSCVRSLPPFHLPAYRLNPKNTGSTYIKSDGNTLWARNAARRAKEPAPVTEV